MGKRTHFTFHEDEEGEGEKIKDREKIDREIVRKIERRADRGGDEYLTVQNTVPTLQKASPRAL